MNLPYLRCNLLMLLFAFSYMLNAQEDSIQTCTHTCCSRDLTPAGVMISHVHNKKEWMISYRYMRMGMGSMISGSANISDQQVYQKYLMSSDRMHMDMHMLMAMYGVNGWLTLMAMADVHYKRMSMTMMQGTTHVHPSGGTSDQESASGMDMRTAGLGDFKMHALLGLIRGVNHQVLLSGGVSFPLGSVQRKGAANSMYPNQRLPYHMQMGSGTWDVLPGITWTYNKNKCSLGAQINAVIRTTNNQEGYRLGNEAILNGWVAYQWIHWLSTSFRTEASKSNAIRGKDELVFAGNEPSADAHNYGCEKLNGFLGIKVHLNEFISHNASIGLEYGLPVYQYVNGIQMKSKSLLALSANVMF